MRFCTATIVFGPMCCGNSNVAYEMKSARIGTRGNPEPVNSSKRPGRTRQQAEGLVQYRGDSALQARIEELAEKNTEGELTDPERAEYEGYVRANKFIATLQAKARKLLAHG